MPVFASSLSIKVGNMWVRRHQVPMAPAFALTEYKVLGSTYSDAVLDLRRQSRADGVDALHKRYCSVYVQLTRPQLLLGTWLLESVTLADLDNKPHPQLRDEDHRLQELAARTMRLETESTIGQEVINPV
jgi:hypothetical protein